MGVVGLGLALAWVWAGVMSAAGCERAGAGESAGRLEYAFGEMGASGSRLAFPRCIDFDGQSLWTLDKAGRLQRFDPATGECTGVWRLENRPSGMPTGITIGPWVDGRRVMYVADTHQHRVVVLPLPEPARSAEGGLVLRAPAAPEPIAQWGGFGRGPGQFYFPTDVCVITETGPDGVERAVRFYVGEYGGNDRVSIFDRNLEFVSSFGRFAVLAGASPPPEVDLARSLEDSGPVGADGSGRGGEEAADSAGGAPASGVDVMFNRPQSIVHDRARDRLVIVDSRNHRLGVLTMAGVPIRWIGSPERSGSGPGEMRFPMGLALLDDGTALVSELGNGRVQRFDLETGESLGVWGRAGRGEGELATPWALVVVESEVFVLDSGNGRVHTFAVPGRGDRGRGSAETSDAGRVR